MFAIDYALWFRTLLPGLARLNAPLPLGGTSNHFRANALIEAGGWDPFNVTEDADLGIRLARLGYQVAILDSATFEEAPQKLGTWLRQRTRWMKGYMQTMLVHSRNPLAVVTEIGPGGAALIASFLGGAVWSALINPVMWIICIYSAFFEPASGGTLAMLARGSGFTLFVANALLAVMAIAKGRSCGEKAGIVLTYPLYWLLISAATYRALWQLVRDPFRWEKTPHGAAG
jgi:cellulose synthase/poly-beta-1,6-N-acetylglucosamine synthase-like glycosyltransferase